MHDGETLAIVPSYRPGNAILQVVDRLLGYVEHVVVVDDFCPDESGIRVSQKFSTDDRVSVIFHEKNRGVGAAMKTGFDWALEQGFAIVVKVDADNQMDSSFIPQMIRIIESGAADMVKGNRFDSVQHLEHMPLLRIIGNAGLSIMSKSSSGLWSVNDPTNGFIAMTNQALISIQHKKLHDRFFFESDLLFRLGIAGCKVQELPMPAIYGEERSNLRISRALLTFPLLHGKNFLKRIAYKYFVQEWSIGTINLLGSFAMLLLALFLGLDTLRVTESTGRPVSVGQAVGVSLTAILGFQLLIAFFAIDVQMERRDGQKFKAYKDRA